MRLCNLIAVICFSAATLGTAAEPPVSRMRTDIKAQGLAPALEQFAQERKLYLIFASSDVKSLRTQGVSGELTSGEALKKILTGTGLTYRFIDQNTVSILPLAAPQKTGDAASPGLQTLTMTLARTQSPAGDDAQRQFVAANAEANASTQPPDGEGSPEVVVTGSRLRTSNSASPVTVVTAEEIRKMGLNTVEDILRALPQSFSTINEASTLDNGMNSIDTRGQSAADLRGLGPQNTLVLVNGRRRAVSSTFTQGVINLNTIPAASIERIEIITDGASAVYGSDAVAGVINFILRKDYQGGETRVRNEASINDGDAFSVDQSLGRSWSKGNITGSARYSHSDGVNSRKAGYTTADFRSLGGRDNRSQTVGQPGRVTRAGALLGSLSATDDGTGGVAGRLSAGNFVPYDAGRFAADTTSERSSLSMNVNAEHGFTDALSLYGEVSYADNKADSSNGPSIVDVMVPTTNRFNNLGSTVRVQYVMAEEFLSGALAPTTFSSNQNALAGTLGLKASLPKDWSADVSASYSTEQTKFNALRMNTVLLNQRAAGRDAAGNPLPAEQHFNPFGNGTAQDPAALAGLLAANVPGFYIPGNESIARSAQLLTEGPVWRMPGGQVRVAAGAERRAEDLDFTRSGSSAYLTLEPGREVSSVFGELTIPVVGAANRVRGVHALDVFAAARWEEYSVAGPFDGPTNPERTETFRRTSPRFGVSWRVTPELKLRASASSAFRAPSLYSLFLEESGPYDDFGPGGFIEIVDPMFPNDGPLVADAWYVGNPAVGPETSDNFTAGVDWVAKGALEGLALAMTYQDIRFTNRIDRTDSFAFDQPALLFTVPGAIERGPDGRVSRVNYLYTNIGERRSESVDVKATYDFSTAIGDVTLGFNEAYTVKLEDISTPGADPVVLSGTEVGPERHKRRMWAGWSGSNYGVNLFANYSSGYINSQLIAAGQRVDSYTTYDVTAYYRFDRSGWSFNGGVRNLTDAAFPFFNSFTRPWDPRRVDTRGRVLFLEITKRYDLFR